MHKPLVRRTLEALELNCLNRLKSSTVLNASKNIPPSRINQFLSVINRPVLIYKRFVDDCLLAVKNTEIDNILSMFNSYHPSLQFTVEVEHNKCLPFLDLNIIRLDNQFAKTNWYRKATFSGRYLNYFSHHPLSQKIAIVFNLVDKCTSFSKSEFHKNN